MSTNAAATEQNQGLPPVTDEDLAPQPTQPVQSQPTQQAQPDSKTDKQQADSQPTPEEAEAKEQGPGPWDAELQKRGLADPAFDSFLREVVQPYVTKLEQGGGGEVEQMFGNVEAAQAMALLLEDIKADPLKAYHELGEVLGLADEQPGELDGVEGDEELDPEVEGVEPESDPFAEERDWIQAQRQKEIEQHEDEQLKGLLEAVGNRVGPGFDENLFIHFLISAGGNRDVALTNYLQYHSHLPKPKTEEAPPTLEGGGTPPPEAPKYDTIDDALDAFLAEDRAQRSK